ncbi:MAG: TPM domain-containing protein [Spirochaetes bacterium]|nr:TPM domain-containing protein [Spirochaetota bacterium]
MLFYKIICFISKLTSNNYLNSAFIKKPLHKSLFFSKYLLLFLITALFITAPAGAAAKQRVFDNGSLLSEEELVTVQQTLDRVSADYDTDLFILTSTSLNGVTPKKHAEDFFWGNNHGTRDESGVVLVVDMGERDVWMATFGRAIQTFEPDVQTIISGITPDLTSARYSDAFLKFSSYMEKPLLEITKPTYLEYVKKMATNWPAYIIALLAALISTGVLSFNLKGAKLVTNKTYEVPDSFVLSETRDTYLRTTTTRTKVSSSSSGSSSGGRSSGGGGGKF